MLIQFNHNTAIIAKAFAEAPQVMIKHVDPAVQRGIMEVAREERQKAPKAFSILTNSINTMKVKPMHWRSRAGADYGIHVEEGTSPHFPNPSTLVPWVKRVLGVAGDADARATAFRVARAISKRGTRAQPFAEPTMVKMEPRVMQLILIGVSAGLQESFS
jgi:hypothetical protein